MQGGLRVKLLREILLVALSLIIISFAVFFLSSLSSGNISYYVLGDNAREEDVLKLSSSLGYDEPILSRYIVFLRNFFTLNWGRTINGYDIRALIAQRASVTVEIMIITLVLSLLVSIPVSLFCIRKEKGFADRFSDALILIIFSLPSFFLAIILMLCFSIYIPLFPSSGFISMRTSVIGNIRTLFLPSLSLTLMHSALYIRVLKRSLSDQMHKSYVLGSLARGKSRKRIILTDAFAPASVSLIALFSQSIASLIAGSAVTETVFAVPGLGSLAVSACLQRDVSVITIIMMIVSLAVALSMIAARILIYAISAKGVEYGR